MQYAHRLEASRFELKFTIHEELPPPICGFQRYYPASGGPALAERSREHDLRDPRMGTPSPTLCRAALRGLRNCVKLRIDPMAKYVACIMVRPPTRACRTLQEAS